MYLILFECKVNTFICKNAIFALLVIYLGIVV